MNNDNNNINNNRDNIAAMPNQRKVTDELVSNYVTILQNFNNNEIIDIRPQKDHSPQLLPLQSKF